MTSSNISVASSQSNHSRKSHTSASMPQRAPTLGVPDAHMRAEKNQIHHISQQARPVDGDNQQIESYYYDDTDTVQPSRSLSVDQTNVTVRRRSLSSEGGEDVEQESQSQPSSSSHLQLNHNYPASPCTGTTTTHYTYELPSPTMDQKFVSDSIPKFPRSTSSVRTSIGSVTASREQRTQCRSVTPSRRGGNQGNHVAGVLSSPPGSIDPATSYYSSGSGLSSPMTIITSLVPASPAQAPPPSPQLVRLNRRQSAATPTITARETPTPVVQYDTQISTLVTDEVHRPPPRARTHSQADQQQDELNSCASGAGRSRLIRHNSAAEETRATTARDIVSVVSGISTTEESNYRAHREPASTAIKVLFDTPSKRSTSRNGGITDDEIKIKGLSFPERSITPNKATNRPSDKSTNAVTTTGSPQAAAPLQAPRHCASPLRARRIIPTAAPHISSRIGRTSLVRGELDREGNRVPIKSRPVTAASPGGAAWGTSSTASSIDSKL
jgi:hypothetical protein